MRGRRSAFEGRVGGGRSPSRGELQAIALAVPLLTEAKMFPLCTHGRWFTPSSHEI